MNELYVTESGNVVNKKQRDAAMALIKVLFRLEVITPEQALTMATKFQILFV